MKRDNTVIRSLAMISQFGINMIVPIFICMAIGIAADRLLGTSFISIIMFFLGAAAGFRNIFIMSKEIYGDDSKRERKH